MRSLLSVCCAAALGALSANAGCLCSPSPKPADQDATTSDATATVDTGTTSDASIDAGGSCKPGPIQAGSAFPPRTLDVRAVVSLDLDGDCHTDIAVAARSTTPAEQGVYILLGRDGADGSIYDAFLNTGGVEPAALTARDLNGDQLADVLVLGADSAQAATLMLFMATGRGSFSAGESLALGLPSMAPAGDAHLALGNLDGDGDTDLLICRGTAVQHVDLSTLIEFSTLTVTHVTQPDNRPDWGDPLLGRFIPGQTAGQDDILVATRVFTYRYRNAAGTLADKPDLSIFTSDGDYDDDPDDNLPGLSEVRMVDINGDGFLDLLGSGGAEVRLVLLDPTATIIPYLFALNDNLFLDEDDNLIDHIRLIQIDDDDAPALLLANSLEFFAGTSTLTLYIKARWQADAPRWAASFTHKISMSDGVHPRGVATGDIDGDGVTEAVVFAADGTPLCFDVRASPGLTACGL